MKTDGEITFSEAMEALRAGETVRGPGGHEVRRGKGDDDLLYYVHCPGNGPVPLYASVAETRWFRPLPKRTLVQEMSDKAYPDGGVVAALDLKARTETARAIGDWMRANRKAGACADDVERNFLEPR